MHKWVIGTKVVGDSVKKSTKEARRQQPPNMITHSPILADPANYSHNEGDFNRPFPNYLRPLFQSESWCSSLHMKISFHSHAKLMKTNFHMKR